jgi:hypothetical protein
MSIPPHHYISNNIICDFPFSKQQWHNLFVVDRVLTWKILEKEYPFIFV